jgi:hypothetical protein
MTTTAPVGFGRSVWCVPGIGLVTGRFASGQVALAQSILRRLQTPRGSLRGGRDEERFGLDLPGLVGSTGASVAVVTLPGMIQAELLKDNRIAAVKATVTPTQTEGAVELLVLIDVTPADESETFSLTLEVDAVLVTVIGGLS